MNNEKGFTLIEMLVVLLIISVLLLITIPNVTKSNEVIDGKGCEAFKELVKSQAQVYKIDTGALPVTIDVLAGDGYLPGTSCPDGTVLQLGTNGNVEEAPAS